MKPLYVKKNGVVYKISGNGMPASYPAANVEYDNTVTSELQATDVQGAIDELSTRQGGVQSDWNENDSTELDYIKNKPQNLVQDASYVHTDNNYDNTAKAKVDSLGTASTKNVGVANGVAELDAAGKVPSSQLPPFVDNTTTSISGNPISISGLKSNQLAVNPIITFEPIQAGSGTPSPSNIRAISGYDKIEVLSGGDNLFDSSAMTTGAYLNADGTTTSSGQWNITDYIEITESGAIYKILASAGSAPKSCWYNANKQFISSFQQVVGENAVDKPADAEYLRMSVYTNEVPTFQVRNKVTSISESLGQTVYGGTLDVRTGKLIIDRAIVDLGDYSWVYNGGTNPFFYNSEYFPNCYHVESTIINPLICTCYESTSQAYRGNNKICEYSTHSNAGRVLIGDFRYTDATTFKTAVTGQKVCYKLSTPFTIQLTPHEISLLKDYAYLSTNGTTIALDYHNGELASLSDVSQLGETLNSIDKSVTSGTLTDLVKQGNYGIFYYELKKSGRLVELYLELYNVRYTTSTRIANLPTGFIPAHRKIANIIAADSGTGLIQKGFMRVEVTNTGEIQAAFMGSTSENIFADVTLMYYV